MLIQSHLLSASSSSITTLTPLKVSPYFKIHNATWSTKPKRNINCSLNMAGGQSNDHEKVNLDSILNKAKKLWDSSPQPVKTFPWNRALDNFIQLILDLFLAVVKYLSIPLLAVSSLSEMSYCTHVKKLFLVPIPLLLGMAFADILRETILELSPLIKNAEVPWHLIAIAIFFILLKFPGPYYPFWGRVLIPHIANGALWRTLWFWFMWYRRPKRAAETALQSSADNTGSSKQNQS